MVNPWFHLLYFTNNSIIGVLYIGKEDSTHKCNPEKDVNVNTNKIQVHANIVHIYDKTSKHLITISYNIFVWLWN